MFACLYGKCITEEPGILGGRKMISGPLELGFPKAVSLWWVLGMEPLSSAKQQVLVTADSGLYTPPPNCLSLLSTTRAGCQRNRTCSWEPEVYLMVQDMVLTELIF